MKKIVVESENERLDKYLSKKVDYSREFIQKLIKDNLILVNEKPTKASYKVQLNDNITIYDEKIEVHTNLKSANIPLDIVYEDEYLMIINKPSGLVVHPGSGNYDNTLANALKFYTDNLSDVSGDMRPGIVHRIDKDTSGLIMVAKTNKVHELLSDDFKNKRIKREYIALVNGVILEDEATIDAPIGRDSKIREKMTITSHNSKKAITHFKVLKRYANNTLISCILETGRTHQIRVHLAYIGHPIHNDPVYSTDNADDFGQFLHSAKMSFYHPITKEYLTFSCPLPEEFENYLKKIA